MAEQIILPPRLKPGDTVAIISPSNSVADKLDQVRAARVNFERLTGLRTILSPHALGRNNYSSGTVQERLDDFHWALNNPEVKGIIIMVGGYTAIDLIDKINYELIRQNPKVIAGISDATTLLNPIFAKTGLVGFLGLEFLDFADQDMSYEVKSIKKAWFEGELGDIKQNINWKDFDDLSSSYSGWQSIKSGSARGTIVGGNLSSFMMFYGTEHLMELDGAILVIETYMYQKRALHRALAQLKAAGYFDKISGLVLGYCVGLEEPTQTGNDISLQKIVQEITDGYDFPVMWVGEIGHNVENLMLPIGAEAFLDADELVFRIEHPVLS